MADEDKPKAEDEKNEPRRDMSVPDLSLDELQSEQVQGGKWVPPPGTNPPPGIH